MTSLGAPLDTGEQPVLGRRTVGGVVIGAVVVLAASFALGGLTSFAQQYLPDTLAPLANSISGWTMLTAALIWLCRTPVLLSALLGAASFVLLTVGYAVVSTARGLFYDPTTWALIGVCAGPFVGAAAAGLRGPGATLRAVAGGVLAGILVGDGVRGLLVLTDTTAWEYWVAVIAIGTALVLGLAGTRLRRPQPIVLLVSVAAVVALGLNLAVALLQSLYIG